MKPQLSLNLGVQASPAGSTVRMAPSSIPNAAAVSIISSPIINRMGDTYSHYEIVGNDIKQIVSECVSRIRKRSQTFYAKEIIRGLISSGICHIDHHAGNGIYYTVKLI